MGNEIQQVLEYLDNLGIEYGFAEHPAVHTIAELMELGLENKDEVAKNLFLRDSKKQHYFLVTLDQHKSANLKELSAMLGVKGLTFASEDDLMKYLCLERGGVTPLGILNDEERAVTVVLDEAVLKYQSVGIHPNVNTASVWLKPSDLVGVIEHHGNRLIIMNM